VATKLYTLTLENTFGRTVAEIHNVPHTDVRRAFDKLCVEAETIACPIIFFDGRGYTQRADFLAMVSTVNACSTRAGGAQVF